MRTRIQGSERTREALNALIDGQARVADAKSELVRLATRLIIEEGLEGEVRDALGRDYYEHGSAPGGGYRNGTREGHLKTAEGRIDYAAPQVAGTVEPFRSELRAHLKGHSEGLEGLAVEMLARGLSVRDIEDAFRDESGRLLLSRTAVSEMGARLWEDYQNFATRDLSEYEIAYLFVDGIAERLRAGHRREPVLAAWSFTVEGKKVLLHLMAGSKEDHETVSAFFQDMRARGLGDPLLVVSDGAPGIIKALETCFPRSARQRCLAHRMRNLAAKVPEEIWPELKTRVQASYQAPSRKIARELAEGVIADYERDYAKCGCLFHGRLRGLHRAPAAADRAPPGDADYEPAGTTVRRRTPASQDHSQRLWREGRPQVDVRRHDACRRALASDQGHRVRATTDGRAQRGTRQRVRCPHRTPNKALGGKASGKYPARIGLDPCGTGEPGRPGQHRPGRQSGEARAIA